MYLLLDLAQTWKTGVSCSFMQDEGWVETNDPGVHLLHPSGKRKRKRMRCEKGDIRLSQAQASCGKRVELSFHEDDHFFIRSRVLAIPFVNASRRWKNARIDPKGVPFDLGRL